MNSGIPEQIKQALSERLNKLFASPQYEDVEAGTPTSIDLEQARAIAAIIPACMGAPEIDLDRDGAFSFEWIWGKGKRLTFSTGANGYPYAWICGAGSGHGVAKGDLAQLAAILTALAPHFTQQDSNELDWLEKNATTVNHDPDFHVDGTGVHRWTIYTTKHHFSGDSLRLALFAARLNTEIKTK